MSDPKVTRASPVWWPQRTNTSRGCAGDDGRSCLGHAGPRPTHVRGFGVFPAAAVGCAARSPPGGAGPACKCRLGCLYFRGSWPGHTAAYCLSLFGTARAGEATPSINGSSVCRRGEEGAATHGGWGRRGTWASGMWQGAGGSLGDAGP